MTGRDVDDPSVRRARAVIALGLVASSFGSGVLLVAYWADGSPQWQGLGLATGLGGLALAVGAWGLRAVPERIAVEHRSGMRSPDADRRAAAASASLDGIGVGRRRGLLALAGLAGGTLLAGVLSPLRSLGPSPFPERRRTGWQAGRRLVDVDGVPLRAEDFDVGSIITAVPEGVPPSDTADSQVVVIRMAEAVLRLDGERRAGAPGGLVAYSRVCTHAGCPVGLYVSRTHELLCPCHQSVFLASEAARPTFGPAARPLPQLPIRIDDHGHLVALGDFPEPVGPSYWTRP